MKTSSIKWHLCDIYPFRFTWVNSKKQYKQALKDCNVDVASNIDNYDNDNNSRVAVIHVLQNGDGGTSYLINFNKDIDFPIHLKLGFLAHEVMHCVQYVAGDIYNRKNARLDEESEAYLFQWIYSTLIADIYPKLSQGND